MRLIQVIGKCPSVWNGKVVSTQKTSFQRAPILAFSVTGEFLSYQRFIEYILISSTPSSIQ